MIKLNMLKGRHALKTENYAWGTKEKTLRLVRCHLVRFVPQPPCSCAENPASTQWSHVCAFEPGGGDSSNYNIHTTV